MSYSAGYSVSILHELHTAQGILFQSCMSYIQHRVLFQSCMSYSTGYSVSILHELHTAQDILFQSCMSYIQRRIFCFNLA